MELYFPFGPNQSFGTTDYYEAREKKGLPDDRTHGLDVFTRAYGRK